MPSLFETVGAVVVAGAAAAASQFDASDALAARAVTASVALVAGAATFMGFRAVWLRSQFDEFPTRRQTARAYLLYFGMPLRVLVAGLGVSLLAHAAMEG